MNSTILYTFEVFTPVFENTMLLVFQDGRLLAEKNMSEDRVVLVFSYDVLKNTHHVS